MNRFIKSITLAAVVIVLPLVSADAKEVKFDASLDKTRIALGETAQLGLSFYGTQSMPAPDLGNIDGLEIRYIGPSTMMTVISGSVSSSITHRYTILPLKIGRFQLGPFAFKYKNDDYLSNMTYLDVAEEKIITKEERAGPGPAEKFDLEDRIFLTIDVAKLSAYVNELIPVTVKLYVNRLNVSDIQLPVFDQEGFSKVEFREPKQYRERMGGVLYEVLEFKTDVFATRPGPYRLGPAKIKCNAIVKKRIARGPSFRDDFSDEFDRDSFFEDFFTHYERYPLELKSQDAELVISGLPTENRPKDFSGAVGDYQFIYKANPTKVKVGDPITIQMDINGTGNFNTVLMPKLDTTEGFKVYEPQVKTQENAKVFRQVLIPETEQLTQVPKALFSYFDPAKKEYRTIDQGPIPVQVEKPKEEAPSQVIGPSQKSIQSRPEDEAARDILYIKESPGRWAGIDRRIYKNKSFIFLALVPLLSLCLLYFVQFRQDRLRRDLVYAGHVNSQKCARDGLKSLKHSVRSKDSKIFYETIFKTLQGYLGHRLGLPPAGITKDVVDRILVHKDIDLNILRKIRNLFDACDESRFAFLEITEMKKHDHLKELEEIIRYFDRIKL